MGGVGVRSTLYRPTYEITLHMLFMMFYRVTLLNFGLDLFQDTKQFVKSVNGYNVSMNNRSSCPHKRGLTVFKLSLLILH